MVTMQRSRQRDVELMDSSFEYFNVPLWIRSASLNDSFDSPTPQSRLLGQLSPLDPPDITFSYIYISFFVFFMKMCDFDHFS